MTFSQALNRLVRNMQTFPTLTLIMVIVAIAEFAETVLWVAAASHSILLGFLAAIGTGIIGFGAALAIFLIISHNPETFRQAESIAESIANFGRQTGTSAETHDEPEPEEPEPELDEELDEEEPDDELVPDTFGQPVDEQEPVPHNFTTCTDPACVLCHSL